MTEIIERITKLEKDTVALLDRLDDGQETDSEKVRLSLRQSIQQAFDLAVSATSTEEYNVARAFLNLARGLLRVYFRDYVTLPYVRAPEPEREDAYLKVKWFSIGAKIFSDIFELTRHRFITRGQDYFARTPEFTGKHVTIRAYKPYQAYQRGKVFGEGEVLERHPVFSWSPQEDISSPDIDFLRYLLPRGFMLIQPKAGHEMFCRRNIFLRKYPMGEKRAISTKFIQCDQHGGRSFQTCNI
jgi:hypothetical protein